MTVTNGQRHIHQRIDRHGVLAVVLIFVGVLYSCRESGKTTDGAVLGRIPGSAGKSVAEDDLVVEFPNFTTVILCGYRKETVREKREYVGPQGALSLSLEVNSSTGHHTITHKGLGSGRLQFDDKVIDGAEFKVSQPWSVIATSSKNSLEQFREQLGSQR